MVLPGWMGALVCLEWLMNKFYFYAFPFKGFTPHSINKTVKDGSDDYLSCSANWQQTQIYI